MYIIRKTTSGAMEQIVLSHEELEIAYQERKRQHLYADAVRHLIKSEWPIPSDSFINKIVDTYDYLQDCNIAENTTWDNAIRFVMQED